MLMILVIDDEREIRDLLKLRLSKTYDCWVDLASSVEQGFELCKKKKYDVMFFDYLFLGDRDGFNFLYDMKRKAITCKTVMISGFMETMDDVVEKGLGVAPDAFIPKPFPDGSIREVMDTFFQDDKFKKK